MNPKKQIVTAVISAALLTGGAAFGQSGDAILDLLTKKGVISQKEANEAREQLDVQNAQTVDAYNKIKTSSWVNSLQFFGDGRLRYEWRAGEGNTGTKAGTYDNTDYDRFRYRLRFGVKGDFFDNFSYGLRLETGQKGNSSNSTMGPALSGGPWNKAGTDGIYVGQLWATYKPTDWLTVTGGKIENPFMNTLMVWDGDLNPEGFAQKLTLKTEPVDYFLTFGEFTYVNSSKQNVLGGGASLPDTWMFGIQGGGKVKFSKDMSFTLAPTFYFYKNGSGNSATGVFNPQWAGGNITGVNDLNVFDMPAEFAYMVPGINVPGKVFGDFAINTTASARMGAFTGADAAGIQAEGSQSIAYQFGASIGASKKKHDWMLKAFWQHTELNALDPNLVDSDIFDSHVNMQGVVVNGQYMLTDFLTFGVTYANARAIDSNIPTLTSAGDLVGNIHAYNLLQADLVWKF